MSTKLPLHTITRTITTSPTRSLRYTSPSLALAATKLANTPTSSSSFPSESKPVTKRSTNGYSRVTKSTGTAAASTSAATKPTSSSIKPSSSATSTTTRKPRTTTTIPRSTPSTAPQAPSTPLPPHTFDPEPRFAPEGDTSDDFNLNFDFPTPQPVADLPDYAKLAPPLNYSHTSSSGSSASSGAVPHLSEHFTNPNTLTPSTQQSQPQPPAPAQAQQPKQVEDWTTSFHGLSAQPFDKDVAEVLLRPLRVRDVEIKPDGLLYLPEIKYRRALNEAFGPGGWGMAPRGETDVGPRIVSREWGLVCLGRLVAIARGEQEYFDPSGVPTATEACKSNALMRCCKDLGIASELWDPSFIREFKAKHCKEAFVEHQVNKKKRKLWRKNDAKFEYPYKEVV